MGNAVLDFISSSGRFIVVIGTLIAGIIQLKHLSKSNRLRGLLAVLASVNSAEIYEWQDETRRILAENLSDRKFRRGLEEGTYERRNNSWLQLGNRFEWTGSLVRQGLIQQEAFLDVTHDQIVRSWELLEPIIAVKRRKSGPQLWENFEYLYVRAMEFKAKYPQGRFPKSIRRATVHDKWAEADAVKM